ncbi:MAG: zinc-ribbon domain-containing protein [Rudaea sp.]
MPNWLEAGNIWKTLREVDLGPIRADAERMTWIAIVGDDERARKTLASALCEEPRKELPGDDASQLGPEPLSLSLNDASSVMTADLIVLLVNLSKDTSRAWRLFQEWQTARKKTVVIFSGEGSPAGFGGSYEDARGLRGSISDRHFLGNEFAAAVLALLPDRNLSLARYYPLLRQRAAQELIGTTSLANANYSLTTGLAEIIPLLDIPFNVADIIILTKNQAIMAYKLGLMFGLPPRWQDHMAAFGGTVGTGFIWRQVARELIGLIPVWGLIPKVAVAYAGTYVLGEAIEQWYLTGRQVTPAMLNRFYQQALDRGRALAGQLVKRSRAEPKKALPAPRRRRLVSAPRLRLPSRTQVKCPSCGATNSGGNKYCGSCGAPLAARR